LKVRQARKYRVYPNNEQKQKLAVQFGHARYVYNWALTKRKEHYKQTGIGLYYLQTQKLLVELKQELPWLKDADSQALQVSLLNLDTAYKNFFQKRARYPKFKSKHGKQSICYPQRVKFSAAKTYIPKVGWVKTTFHRELIGTQKSVTVSKTKTGKYFVSVLCEWGMEIPENHNPSVGIDLGLKNFATLSTGESIGSPKHLRNAEGKLVRAQRKLSRKKKGSANRKKARLRVARLHEHVTNQRKDFLHKLSRNVVDRFGFIAIEDLNVSGMIRNRRLSKSISDSGWYTFVTMCQYKAQVAGGYVEKVNRFFPSSKTCSCCGFVNPDLQLSEREWVCPECNSYLDRDVNAAVNILAQTTAGAAGSNACGDYVRPVESLAQ
jgi:putative transposase